ncbi:MAG: TetR family transcriptional regulator [Christensenellaceae bacterium]
MDSKQDSKKQLILNSAIEILCTDGHLTVRKIAQKSGLNVAAINYYFGDKQNLMFEMENHMAKAYHQIYSGLDVNDADITNVLSNRIFDFLNLYPGFFSFINLSTTLTEYNPTRLWNEIIQYPLGGIIQKLIRAKSSVTDEQEINNRCISFLGSLSFLVLIGYANIELSTHYENILQNKTLFDSYMNTLFHAVLAN